MVVLFVDVTGAFTPPTVTTAPAMKSVPEIVTLTPPPAGTVVGLMEVMVGLEMRVKKTVLLVNPFDDAMTDAVPGGMEGTVA
jgi:hypothetical protein